MAGELDQLFPTIQNEEMERLTLTRRVQGCFVCIIIWLLAFLIAFLIFRPTTKSQDWCLVEVAQSEYNFTTLGSYGWLVFLPQSLDTMMSAQIQISLLDSEGGNGIFSDSPTQITWKNGNYVTQGTSNSYASYPGNLSLIFDVIQPNMEMNMNIGIILWCSNCTLQSSNGSCTQSIQNQWIRYQMEISGSHIVLTVQPHAGNIRLEGIYVGPGNK